MSGTVRSDHLLDLREFFLGWEAFFRLMELLPQFRLVVDTNSILQELLFIVESQRNPLARTNLQEAIDSGAIAAFAPLKLKEEISRHIPRLAAERGIPEESLTRAWRDYESRINYVIVGQNDVHEAVTVADPDDLPFVYLYRKINADAVLTRDKDIPAMGAESVELEAALHIREYARAKAPEVMLRAGATVITIPVVAGALALGRISGRAIKTFSGFPPWVQLALILGALAVGINPRSRKALSSSVSPLLTKFKENVPVLLHLLGALAEELNTARQKVDDHERVLEASIPRSTKRPLKLVGRSVCLQSGAPLTVEELTRGVLRAGYESNSSQLKHYLLRVLRQSEQFVCTTDGRWSVRTDEEAAATY